MDSTKDWFAVVRTLRQPSAKDEANQAPTVALRAGGFSSAAEAVVGSRWRTPLTPFMQQVRRGAKHVGHEVSRDVGFKQRVWVVCGMSCIDVPSYP